MVYLKAKTVSSMRESALLKEPISYKNGIMTFFLVGFLLICLFFPGDPYHIKLLFFAAACIYGIGTLAHQFKCGRYGLIFLMGILYPAAIIISSAIMTGNVSAAASGGYPAVLIVLVILINEDQIPYEKLLMVLLQLMVLATLALIAMDAVGIYSVNAPNIIRNAFYGFDMGLMGKSPEYAAFYKVFFKASPLMIMLLPYCFRNRKYLMACLTLLALVFSGTRANILVGMVVFLFGCIDIWSSGEKNYKLRLLVFVLAIAAIVMVIPTAVEMVGNMMNAAGSVSSDAVRSGQLGSFLQVFSRPGYFLFGMGFGSEFYDAGRMAFSADSEISYLDLIRKIGFLMFLPLLLFILNPFRWKMGTHTKLAYLGYLLSAFTNPLLFSSTAYVLYIYLYSKYYRGEWEPVGHRQFWEKETGGR